MLAVCWYKMPWELVFQFGMHRFAPVGAGKPHTPAVFPTVNHLPTFNTMAMFTVMPGKSFHAVQVRPLVEGRLLLAQPGSWPRLKHRCAGWLEETNLS